MIALTAPALGPMRHAFFGRTDGVSEGGWASLNMGWRSGDDAANVRRNRAIAASRLGLSPEALVTARQVHGVRCIAVKRAWAADDAPEADALVTDRPGVLIGALGADCAPVLLADAQAGVIGAAHAGWRGALDGVIASVVTGMVRLGAEPARIAAVVGPCIAQASYEVGPEFETRFLAVDLAHGRFFQADAASDRRRFDLEGFIAGRLRVAGVATVERQGRDTCAEADSFFSYRRASLRGEGAFGLQLAAIALPG